MHLHLVALLAALVHLSSPRDIDENEVFMKLDDGFPDGSLLTVFFKYTGSDGSIGINLYEDVSTDKGRLHFRMDKSENLVSRRGEDGSAVGWLAGVEPEQGKPLKYGAVNPPELQAGSWWRFDLYKISETVYLPFFNGFALKERKLLSPSKTSGVYIVPTPDPQSGNPNYDKNDVYVTIKHPEIGTKSDATCGVMCNPETVLDSFDKQSVEGSKELRFTVRTLKDGFPVGKTIRLSALMLSADADHQGFFPTLYFATLAGDWAFGIYSNFDGGKNKLYLMMGFKIPKTQGKIWNPNPSVYYKSVMCDDDSTDIVHVKIWRPDITTLKMRIYYKDGKAGGKTCQMGPNEQPPSGVGTEAAKYLENALQVLEHQGAKVLHIDMF